METPKSKTAHGLAKQVVQLTVDEIDRMRLESRQDGAWAKLQLGPRAENSSCIERQAAQSAISSATMPSSSAPSDMSSNDQARAAVLSVGRYLAVECMAQREKVSEAEKLVELSARFDQLLSSLNGRQAHQALNAFMDEPIKLSETLHAGAPY